MPTNAFEPGNNIWRLRLTTGRPKIFETPDDLAAAANNYFDWAAANPLNEAVLQKIKVDRDSEKVKVYNLPKMRPLTIEGLCNFIDLSVSAFYEYEKRADFVEIVTRVRQIIYNQKFEGAAAGFFNPSIIARDLGLVEKSQKTIVAEQPLFSDDPDGEE